MADVRDWTPAPTFDDIAFTPHVDLNPVMPIAVALTKSWVKMLLPLKEQLFQRDSILNQPVVGPPFVDAVVRRFLLKRSVEIIKEEAYLPLTVSSIAARNHISVRALQRRFRDHFAVSPTEYLRQVRLRHAHRSLLLSDPSTVTVGGRLGRPQPEWAGFGRLVRSYIEGHKGERARYVTERTSMTGRRHRALKSL